MNALGDFIDIKNNIATAKRMTIVAAHKLFFGEEGDRDNRKRIRMFMGFDFDENGVLYEAKKKYVEETLSDADLVAVCSMLCLSYKNNNNLFEYIFSNMKKGQLMCCQENDAASNDGYDDDDVNDDNDDTIVYNDVSNNNDARNRFLEQNDVRAIKGENDGSSSSKMVKKTLEKSKYVGVNTQKTQYVKQKTINVDGTACLNMQRFAMNYRDIEDSIPSFDGDGNMPIDIWISEFEETSLIMGFDDFQMFIFAKKIFERFS